MASKYTYSKRAAQQVASIYREIYENWGSKLADTYDKKISVAVAMLANNPDAGQNCDDIREGYQRFEVGSHIIFYRKRENDIFIVQIIHNRMDASRRL